MPIYEYVCIGCHHHFDLMQKINDDPVKQCPKCFHNSVIKLVSASGFQLKGTGWYKTDYKSTKNTENTSEKASDIKKDESVNTVKPKQDEAK